MSMPPHGYPNQQLRAARLERGWTQQDLADRLGTTVVTVKRWERGVQQPSPYFRLKLTTLFATTEQALGLSPAVSGEEGELVSESAEHLAQPHPDEMISQANQVASNVQR